MVIQTQSLAMELEHPGEHVRPLALAPHPSAELRVVQLPSAGGPQPAQDALLPLREVPPQPVDEEVLDRERQSQCDVPRGSGAGVGGRGQYGRGLVIGEPWDYW